MARERKYIPDNEIHHLWAHRAKPEGTTRPAALMSGGFGSRQSFRGDVFYSYSTGIAKIGKHKKVDYVIYNVTNFGPTTSKHLQGCRDATCHFDRKFSVELGRGNDMDLTPRELVSYYRTKGEEKSKETHKQKRMMFGIWADARRWYIQAVDCAKFFGLPYKALEKKVQWCIAQQATYVEAMEKWEAGAQDRDAKRQQAYRDRQKRWDDAQKAGNRIRVLKFISDPKDESDAVPYHGYVPDDLTEQYLAACKVREEWKLEQKKELLEDWMMGGRDDTWELRDLPVSLRATGAGFMMVIETSHGAVIPYEDGKQAFRFIQRHKGKAWRRNGEQCQVGHYQIDSITEDGSIVAGCHRISHEEIVRFATQEGWIQSTEGEQS